MCARVSKRLILGLVRLALLTLAVEPAAAQPAFLVGFRVLAAFQQEAPDAAVVINFDEITPGTDISGLEIAGITFIAAGSPLIVVRAGDTFTPAGSFASYFNAHPGADPALYKLTPTSGQNALSPGGTVLAEGANDGLRLRFSPPVRAFGFDVLWQFEDKGAGNITFFDEAGKEIYRNTLADSMFSPGTPGGSDFFGVVSNQSNIAEILIGGTSVLNVGYDTLRVWSPCPVYRWTGAEGDFNNPNNWSEHAVPGDEDALLFAQDGSVAFSQDVTSAALTVTTGHANLLLNGRIYKFTESTACGARPSITVGADGTDPLTSGLALVGGQVEAGSAFIGEKSGTAGTLALREKCRFTSTTGCVVGERGIAELWLAEGSEFSGRDMTLGTQPGSKGTVKVGPAADIGDTHWRIVENGSLTVGSAGSAELFIDARGVAELHAPTTAGRSAGGSGTITVRGRMDLFSAEGLILGDAGNALLLVEAGGQVASPLVWLGKQVGSFGQGKVQGAGSKLSTDNLRVGASPEGNMGRAVFSVLDGAEVDIGKGSIDGDKERDPSLVIVSGAGSALRVRPGGFLVVGFAGAGTLSIGASGGGEVTTDVLQIGNAPSAVGSVDVGNGGTLVVNSADTRVGAAGFGELIITTQGSVRSLGDSRIGSLEGSSGTVTVTGAESKWIQSGELSVGDEGSGELTIQNGATVQSTRVNIGVGPTGSGVVEITGGGRWLADFVAVGAEGAGSVTVDDDSLLQTRFLGYSSRSRVESSTIYIGGIAAPEQRAAKGSRTAQAIAAPTTGIVTQTLIVQEGAVIQVGSVTFAEGGTLGGNGTFPFDVTNAGVVAPGGDQPAAGTFTVNGNYTQADNGRLEIELGGWEPGTEHDVLAVSGHAHLNGTLRVSLINDFVPQPGDRFEVMTFASQEGQFATVDNSALPPGLVLTPEYRTTSISMLAVQADGSSTAVLHGACGGGACGAGVTTMLPLSLVAMGRWRYRLRRCDSDGRSGQARQTEEVSNQRSS